MRHHTRAVTPVPSIAGLPGLTLISRAKALPRGAALGTLCGAITLLLAACGGGGSAGGDGLASAGPTAQALRDGGRGRGRERDDDDVKKPPVVAAPVITAQPQNASVLTDGVASFSVTATGTGLSYQWSRNGVAIAGATAASFSTPPVSWLDAGSTYAVTVTGTGGSVTSSAATLSLALSASQQIFESFYLAPGTGGTVLRWNLNLAGAQIPGINYLQSDSATVALSPLTNGPQTLVQAPLQNLTTTLTLVNEAPTRVLKDGAVRVVPSAGYRTVYRYVGSDVQLDFIADDNLTVAYSQSRSAYSLVPLAGPVNTAPAEFAQWHNSLFANPAALKAGATWLPGASYVRFSATNKGDRYNVTDCSATLITTGPNPTPCFVGTTLTAALTTGITSTNDGRTYTLADGSIVTLAGVPVFVATTPRPFSANPSATTQYRIYYELGGNVYTGNLIKDGDIVSGSFFVSNLAGATLADRLTTLPYTLRINQAARDSLAAAVAF